MRINNLTNDAILQILFRLSHKNRRLMIKTSKRFKKLYNRHRSLFNAISASKIQAQARGIRNRKTARSLNFQRASNELAAFYKAQAIMRGNSSNGLSNLSINNLN